MQQSIANRGLSRSTDCLWLLGVSDEFTRDDGQFHAPLSHETSCDTYDRRAVSPGVNNIDPFRETRMNVDCRSKPFATSHGTSRNLAREITLFSTEVS